MFTLGLDSEEEFNMRVLPKFAKMLTLLSLGFLSTQALAQNFCNATHSGTSIRKTESWAKDYIGDYNYEIWYDGGNNSATFYSDGSFSCEFSNTKDYLCRSGYAYDMTKTWQELGHLYADFSVKMSNLNNIGYSYIGVYGWSNDPLIEYYIVDTWGSQYRPEWMQYKGTITVDGAEYDLYYHRQINQPAINGNADFDQYFSIRKQKRSCGTIDITKHFEEWHKVGWKLGKMYEAKVLGEGGNTNGGASGSFDFNYAKVRVGGGSTPTSSSSVNNPASSSAVVNPVEVTNIPGTVELENYATSGGDEVTVYGNIVGEIKPGAWLEYPMSVTSAGIYTVDLLAARQDDQNRTTTVDISVDGKAVASITGILTTGWNDYDSFTAETTNLTAGSHTLRVTFAGGYVNVDNLKFTKKTTASSSSANQSSSSVKQSSSSAKLSSSSALVQSSSSAQAESSASVESSSSALEISSATAESSSSSEVSSAAMEISSFAIGESSSSVGQWYSSATMAMTKVQFLIEGNRNLQVFDMQGRFLGRVTVAQGTSLEQVLLAMFQKPGAYLVKQGGRLTQVRVTR